MQRAIWAMPPLPGAHTTSVIRWLRFTAQASACSRPPEPRIKTFIAQLPMAPAFARLQQAILGNRGVGSQTGWMEWAELPVPYTDAW